MARITNWFRSGPVFIQGKAPPKLAGRLWTGELCPSSRSSAVSRNASNLIPQLSCPTLLSMGIVLFFHFVTYGVFPDHIGHLFCIQKIHIYRICSHCHHHSMLLEPFDNAGSYVHSDDPRFRISFEIDRLVASQMIYLQKLRRHNRFGWTEGDFLSDENRGQLSFCR